MFWLAFERLVVVTADICWLLWTDWTPEESFRRLTWLEDSVETSAHGPDTLGDVYRDFTQPLRENSAWPFLYTQIHI